MTSARSSAVIVVSFQVCPFRSQTLLTSVWITTAFSPASVRALTLAMPLPNSPRMTLLTISWKCSKLAVVVSTASEVVVNVPDIFLMASTITPLESFPAEITALKEPYFLIKWSIAYPCSFADSFILDSKTSIEPPASVISAVSLSHFEVITVSSILFLRSPPPANISHNCSATSVHSSVALFASPKIYSNVFIHPVLTASLTESIASLKVRAC